MNMGSTVQRLGERSTRSDIIISAEEASRSVFCFAGEFGYEMIAWLPYLLYLKRRLGLHMETCSRYGSCVFYYFSDKHHELQKGVVGDMWGDMETYATIQRQLGGRRVIYPDSRRRICIEGIEWKVKNIHSRIPNENYCCLDYSFINDPLPFQFDRQFVVLNNKSFLQWGSDIPFNYFDPEELQQIKDLLVKKGYGVVYNHFTEGTKHDRFFHVNDNRIFGEDEFTFDMRTYYDSHPNAADWNRMQIATYNRSTRVLGPQGGNLYLPAICRRDLVILMRMGDYIDYLELSRLYDINIDAFYEVRHMLTWLNAVLPDSDKIAERAHRSLTDPCR